MRLTEKEKHIALSKFHAYIDSLATVDGSSITTILQRRESINPNDILEYIEASSCYKTDNCRQGSNFYWGICITCLNDIIEYKKSTSCSIPPFLKK